MRAERQQIMQLFASGVSNALMLEPADGDDDNMSLKPQPDQGDCKMESHIDLCFAVADENGQRISMIPPTDKQALPLLVGGDEPNETTFDLRQEIECLLSNYRRVMDKNHELQSALESTKKEDSMQHDFNCKFG